VSNYSLRGIVDGFVGRIGRKTARGTAPVTVIEPEQPSLDPRLIRYRALAQAAGLDRLYLLLSFDCDTDEDVPAAKALSRELSRRGVRGSFAVPGIQLQRGAATYRRLAEEGAEFMNHGALPHAEWRDTRYYSTTFYSEMTPQAVVEDMHAGHHIVEKIIGRAPLGFRAPHFGCFQAPEQLELVYRTARDLGYRYCSTTIPDHALDRGPFYAAGRLWEVPLSGSYRYPSTLLDSWTYLSSYEEYTLKEEYYELFEETVRRLTEERVPGLLSFYVDPAHVVDQSPFLRALDVIREHEVPSLQFRDVVALAEKSGSPEPAGSADT
jgi:peptidoglycan/xylan/chitin deacetylase (PgdA/CDA1 family)